MNKAAPDILLAKSRFANGSILTLEKHLLDTEKAAEHIFHLDGRWGKNWCRFFKIDGDAAQQNFLLHLRIAALFHDIGKANEDFYQAVSATGFFAQTLRHEHLSALILHLKDLRQWLALNPALDLAVITAAVLSHHLKASEGGERKWAQPQVHRNKYNLRLYLEHPEVKTTLSRIAELANLPPAPPLPILSWGNNDLWNSAYKDGKKAADFFGLELNEDKDRLALLLAVKAGLIVSDAAASGLVRENHSIEKWIEEVVYKPAVTFDNINDKIINARIKQISKTKPFAFHTFQDKAATLGSRALLLAACGAGKTMAAWKWAAEQARNFNIGKVIFLYPTRGTATEGFRDYVGWAPDAEAMLLTGTAKYELEAMRDNPSEATKDKHYTPSEKDARLFALGLWSRSFFSATVDQFLSFIEHNYQSICLLPVLADSAVIIDEVHSFDRHMFDNLIAFLQNFNLPVLCMTATLPPSRRQELINAGLKVYPTSDDYKELADLKEKEDYPRYQIHKLTSENDAMPIAIAAYKEGLRVLWVVNTVDRCQRLANLLATQLKIDDLLCYHSRYRLTDRQQIHQKTVNAFQQQRQAAIAVTTQVCEMSLDLDADILITEIAPSTSLIQRFGRAHRHLNRNAQFRAKIYIYRPESNAPYQPEDIDAAKNFLTAISEGEISQRQLADLLEMHAKSEPDADGSARFLAGGYYAIPGPFRDGDEFSTPAILDSDLDAVEQCLKANRAYDGFIANIPKKFLNNDLPRPAWLSKYIAIAKSEDYDAQLGFYRKDV